MRWRSTSSRATMRSATLELRTGGFYALHEPAGSVRVFVQGFDFSQHAEAAALPLRRALIDAVVGRRVQLADASALELERYPGLVLAALGESEMRMGPGGTLRAVRHDAHGAHGARHGQLAAAGPRARAAERLPGREEERSRRDRALPARCPAPDRARAPRSLRSCSSPAARRGRAAAAATVEPAEPGPRRPHRGASGWPSSTRRAVRSTARLSSSSSRLARPAWPCRSCGSSARECPSPSTSSRARRASGPAAFSSSMRTSGPPRPTSRPRSPTSCCVRRVACRCRSCRAHPRPPWCRWPRRARPISRSTATTSPRCWTPPTCGSGTGSSRGPRSARRSRCRASIRPRPAAPSSRSACWEPPSPAIPWITTSASP